MKLQQVREDIQQFNKSSVICNIVEKNKKECTYISLIENLQREKMTLSEKVKTYKKLYDNFNCDKEELYKNINIHKTTINKYFRFKNFRQT